MGSSPEFFRLLYAVAKIAFILDIISTDQYIIHFVHCFCSVMEYNYEDNLWPLLSVFLICNTGSHPSTY